MQKRWPQATTTAELRAIWHIHSPTKESTELVLPSTALRRLLKLKQAHGEPIVKDEVKRMFSLAPNIMSAPEQVTDTLFLPTVRFFFALPAENATMQVSIGFFFGNAEGCYSELSGYSQQDISNAFKAQVWSKIDKFRQFLLNHEGTCASPEELEPIEDTLTITL